MIRNPQFAYCAACRAALIRGDYRHLEPIGQAVEIPSEGPQGESAYYRFYQCPDCGHVWQTVVDLHAGGVKTFRPITSPDQPPDEFPEPASPHVPPAAE
jgi:hypothetical protein